MIVEVTFAKFEVFDVLDVFTEYGKVKLLEIDFKYVLDEIVINIVPFVDDVAGVYKT